MAEDVDDSMKVTMVSDPTVTGFVYLRWMEDGVMTEVKAMVPPELAMRLSQNLRELTIGLAN
jgi:hypothetical protein